MSAAKSKTGTREWSSHSVNCCTGCSNGCLYCYARIQSKRFGRIKHWSDWSDERPMPSERIANDPKFSMRYRGVVMFPTAHDLTPGTVNSALHALARLLVAGNNVLLVTKPRLDIMPLVVWLNTFYCEMSNAKMRSEKTGDQRTPHSALPHLEVRCTITCLTDSIRQVWEPNAPSILERVDALAYLHEQGVPTSVSIEPCLEPEKVHTLVEALDPFVSETIWIGKLNKLRERTNWCFGLSGLPPTQSMFLRAEIERLEAQQTDDAVMQVVERLQGNPKIRWKDSYREVIERTTGEHK